MIYYFSGTGNSKWTAEYCAKLLNTSAQSITDAIITDDEAIGLVFPCYCSGVPDIVMKWVRKQNFSQAKYVWAICTCGNNSGRSFRQLQSIIPNLMFGEDLVMPDNCIVFAHTPERVEQLLESAPSRLADIVDKIRDLESNLHNLKGGYLQKAIGGISWAGMKLLGIGRKQVSADKCVSCGLCMRICPTANINMVGNKPVFGNECADCFGCIQRCPEGAIRFGSISVSERTRYIHPSLKGQE